jgi:O-antigen/teichoic acid export membrane protein
MKKVLSLINPYPSDDTKDKENDNGKKETIYALAYSLLSKAVTYFSLIVFANFYLPSEYGLGSFVLNIKNIVTLFLFFGIPDALIPLLVRKRKVSSILKIINYSTIFVFFLGLIISVKQPWILPLVLTLPLNLFSSLATAFWRVKTRYDIQYKVGLFAAIIILVSAFLLRDYGQLGFISAYSLGYLYSFFALVYPLRNEIRNSFKGRFFFNEAKDYFKTALVVTLIGGIFPLLIWIDSTILGILGTYENVASFGISSALAGIISIIPISLSMFIITRVSQVIEIKKSQRILHRVVRVSFFISLLTSILIVTFLDLIVRIFFKNYTGMELSSAILIIGTIFFASYFIIYSYYVGKMKPNKALIPVILGLIINIALSVLLVNSLGIIGVSIAYAFTHLFILLYLAKNEKMKRVAVMSVFAIFAVLLSSFNMYLGIAIFFLTIPLSIATKIINMEDINVIRNTIFKSIKL